ncbi:hypothetical protein K469DRAFT_665728 [Zopfia rhizophila CBS 207.26]|uniref:FAD/NAD(P)-binding domain-containing protein n=1 Tax=Zopfia rhizophila CBS 207.26 TaxID=1314779 RepID=A0A6A6DZH8_9PEZI|nr:hypothetical protein K469DRAFT_665728 [Zopfia rhizophila CBS 207.26]
MKSVGIVGGGPAGLVAAKTLLHATPNQFKVTIFEAAERVGGMWRAKRGEQGDKCSPEMRTNLSRFTVAFSDLSWDSVNLKNEGAGEDTGAGLSMFPQAWQVGRYLQEYAKRFIPKGVIHCHRSATYVERTSECHQKWLVTSVDKISKTNYSDEFDYLIVASGFFDRAGSAFATPNKMIPAVVSRLQHSSEFREVSSLTDIPGNIVVVGGGISGCEAAATAAFQISSAKYSPGPKPEWANSKVYHVFNRPFYCLPRYLPQDPYNQAIQGYTPAPKFLPLDLTLYNLSRRKDNPISPTNGQMPPDRAKKSHEFIRSLIGGDQRGIGHPELVYNPEQTQFPAFAGIADMYTEFVREGSIVPVRGRAKDIEIQDSSGPLVLIVQQAWPWTTGGVPESRIDNVVSMIDATGFNVSLPYLSQSTRTALEHDPRSHRLPFLFAAGSIFNPAVPDIAFVGFYEGPYWGVMEMQAHLIAQRWSNKNAGDDSISVAQVQEMRILRDAIKAHSNDVPQFWMNDYVGLVEGFSRDVGIRRDDSAFGSREGPSFAARYVGPGGDKDEAKRMIQDVRNALEDSQTKARFVAAAAFTAMQGVWTLQRKIDSRSQFSPGGTLKGTAHFHPRNPTEPGYTAEYLYMEEGTFTMDTGYSFPATRRYVYRYNEDTDKISAWFVKEDGVSVERFFNEMRFQECTDTLKGWIAKGTHWCDPDNYNSSCEFRFRGASLETFGITYDVNGPKKDYTMESWYKRPALVP